MSDPTKPIKRVGRHPFSHWSYFIYNTDERLHGIIVVRLPLVNHMRVSRYIELKRLWDALPGDHYHHLFTPETEDDDE